MITLEEIKKIMIESKLDGQFRKNFRYNWIRSIF